MSTYEKQLEILNMIIRDMETDVDDFNGKPFDGKTLAEIHGTLAATIQAVANVLKHHIEEQPHDTDQ